MIQTLHFNFHPYGWNWKIVFLSEFNICSFFILNVLLYSKNVIYESLLKFKLKLHKKFAYMGNDILRYQCFQLLWYY